uniref:AlNc14C357G10961 protein n=1 Tax=Albugo laibachii Nc14 TaxID=890382 RepID=F0WXL0_9STRA|nr:AlNc14C357G10961 [Albugo laibachii Nc14]|eukprot:CCA26204.1 AlNc14C357G10961 [Albugo laibachii Nc14]
MTLLIDRGMMELMGYSTDAILGAARQSKDILDASWIDESPEDSTSSCRLLKKCDEECYANDNSCLDEREAYMMSPEVIKAEAQKDVVTEILKSKVVEAGEKRAKEESLSRLTSLLCRYQDVFSLKFAADPPFKVPPLKVQQKEGTEPVMARFRRYQPLHGDYLKEHISSLEKHSLVYRNSDLRWGSANRIVEKKEVGSY